MNFLGPRKLTYQLTDAARETFLPYPREIQLSQLSKNCQNSVYFSEDLLTGLLLYHTLTFQPPQSYNFVDVKLSARKN